MDGSEERIRVLGVSRGNAAPALEIQESVFDQMARFIQVFVIRPLHDAVFSRRDHGLHALIFGPLDDGVAVVSFIGDQIIGAHAFDQPVSLRAISPGTLRDNDSERHTKRIHGQMYFCVEPPFVRLMS